MEEGDTHILLQTEVIGNLRDLLQVGLGAAQEVRLEQAPYIGLNAGPFAFPSLDQGRLHGAQLASREEPWLATPF